MKKHTAADRGQSGDQRRTRWRSAKSRDDDRPRSRVPARVAWSVASAVLMGAIALLVIPPLFIWHAAVVQLSIDEYDIGTIAPLPCGRRDAEAIEAAVRGKLAPSMERKALTLQAFETATALREQLRPRLAALPLRPRDVLLAVVRAQTAVTALSHDGGRSDGGQPCVLAGDLRMAAPLPAERVPCIEIIASLAASPARTTVVAMDFGDLRWDPRLGVVAGLVPAQLDRECADPPESFARESASSNSERHCWILGSHDTLEFSGISLAASRSFFSRALEQALAGAADDPRWGAAGGDGDGVVELDELARFTAAWTSRWARQESSDEFDQRPVLWKVGVGRVPLDAIPPGIPVIRVGTAAVSRPLPTAQIAAPALPAEKPTAGEAKTPEPATPSAAPENMARQPSTPTLWELLDRAAGRSATSSQDAALATDGPAPVDYVPHVWRDLESLAAAVTSTARDDSPLATRAEVLERRLTMGLDRFDDKDAAKRLPGDADAALARLDEARQAAIAAGFQTAWKNMPRELRQSLADRNQSIEMLWAAAAWSGTVSGGTRNPPLIRSLQLLVDRLRGLQREIDRILSQPGEEETRFTSLERARLKLESVASDLGDEIATAVDELLDRSNGTENRPPTAALRWLAASRLPSAQQRQRLAAALRAKDAAPVPESSTDQSATGARQPAKDRWLPLDGSPPRVPTERQPIDRTAWQHLAEQLGLFRQILGISAQEKPQNDVADAELDAAIKEIVATADDPPRAAAAALRAGGLLAGAQSRIPDEIDAAMRGRRALPADALRAVDGFLRGTDPRDASRIRPDARGWVPPVNAAAPLTIAVTSNESVLDLAIPRRTTVALASGDAFPAGGTLRLEYDPARLNVRASGGDVLEPGRSVKADAFGSRDRIQLEVTAKRRVGARAAAAEATATLAVTLELGARRERGAIAFELPVVERLTVAVRGQTGTVDAISDPDGWLRRTLEPISHDGAESRADEGRGTAIRLRPFPGHVTSWELSLVNQTAAARRVAIELIAVDSAASVGERPGAGSSANTLPDEDAWTKVAVAVARGIRLPTNARVVTSLGELDLPASDRPVPILFPQPAAQASTAKATGTTKEPAGTPPETDGLGPNLAIVIRDLVADESAASGTKEEPSARPAGLPPSKARTWLVRLQLNPQHPRRYLDAVARWLREDRSIAIDLRPRGGDPRLLPASGARANGGPLAANVARNQPLAMRKLTAIVTGAQPADELRGQWNGVDEAAAWVAIDVDGYPRARVFRIECGPASSGLEQMPQEDWRQVEIVRPPRDGAAYRAPAEAITVGLAVDGPPDAFGIAGGGIELSVRQDRGLAGGLPDVGRVVWRGSLDRQVTYTAEPAEPPQTLAVRATVADWQIPLADLGFRDVDVIMEVRLNVPGEASARSASRKIVFDGSPPLVTAPPRVVVDKGKQASLSIKPEDGLAFNPEAGGRRAGASGVERLEWGIDAKGNGTPEKWETAAVDPGGGFVVSVPTDALPLGRHRLVFRAFDRVGLESLPAASELEVVAPPPTLATAADAAAVDKRNALHGRVTLDGKPQGGIQVVIEGPGGITSATTGFDGTFSAVGLEPGEYRLSVREASIKNRLYRAGPKSAVVSPLPAKPATVDVPLE